MKSRIYKTSRLIFLFFFITAVNAENVAIESKNMSFDNEKILIQEFKPGKVLPSKNKESSLLKFKQEFEKLIK